MKKLFSINGHGFVQVREEDRIIIVHDYGSKARLYFDYDGNRIPAPAIVCDDVYDDEDEEPDDPTYYKELDNGFFAYTTHEVEETVDDTFGLFGIKDQNGNILVEEKFWDIGRFTNGMCPVRKVDGDWGCINEKCELVLPHMYEIPPVFNKYGVAYGNDSLIDMQGNELPDTSFGVFEYVNEEQRYFPLVVFTQEQDEQIERTGHAEGITESVYDTKEQNYVIRDIPECRINYSSFDGEPDVIKAAAELIDVYDSIWIEEKGIIIGRKEDESVIYDYYA